MRLQWLFLSYSRNWPFLYGVETPVHRLPPSGCQLIILVAPCGYAQASFHHLAKRFPKNNLVFQAPRMFYAAEAPLLRPNAHINLTLPPAPWVLTHLQPARWIMPTHDMHEPGMPVGASPPGREHEPLGPPWYQTASDGPAMNCSSPVGFTVSPTQPRRVLALRVCMLVSDA
jgi:hypothetical protein